jgi:RNA polymerase sigma-70 factor (ECF subfamily)
MEKDFIALINQNRGLLYKVCHVYEREREYQQDLFQEIVLQLWRAYPMFRGEARVTTWMYRIALNTAISYVRQILRRPALQALSSDEALVPALESLEDESDSIAMLKEAIQRLTNIEKALMMLYLEEKSYREIADIMGITTSNVGVKLNRIKSKLEQIIKTLPS